MDEKSSVVLGISPAQARARKMWLLQQLVLVALITIIAFHFDIVRLLRKRRDCRAVCSVQNKSSTAQRWSEIKPSKEMVWYLCYDTYDCAKLIVPLDWLDESDPRRAIIAIIRYNATDRSDYKGPVFINPGGPGGSGIWFVKHLAPYYQSVVGKNHDIISFDPRGIGATEPNIKCWNGTYGSTLSLLWDMQDPPNADAHPGSVYDTYAHAAAYSRHCAQNMGDVARFVSTPSVAKDMAHIVEKLGEDKLQYWGFSYGTYLGTVFAALFPEKVGRLVLDGNVDATEFSNGAGTHFLADTDKVMQAFFTYCHRAGPLLCAFYADSPQAIETRLDNLYKDLKIHPVIVSASSSNSRPEIVSFSKVRTQVSSSFYRPLVIFPALAEALAALEKGDGRPFLDLTSQGSEEFPMCQKQVDPTEGDPEDPTPETPEAEGNREATRAIMCSDARPAEGGVEGFVEYVDTLTNMSISAGATMSNMWGACMEWGVKAKWEFHGPFEGNTSHPILFVANTADNVTPYRSAVANAKGFPGSVIMVQDTYGHTSLAMPSLCTALNIRKYFQTGELPLPGTVCAPKYLPFDRWNGTTIGAQATQIDDLDEALLLLMKAPVVSHGL